jgi:hypothetical protein
VDDLIHRLEKEIRMPDLSKTAIIIVLDRSGSMAPIATDMEGALETFINGQKGVPGSATVTLYQFDTKVELLFVNKPLDEVDHIRLVPGERTALNDALGRAINETGVRLAALEEATRPGSVIVVVVTDGKENASRTFSPAVIQHMVEHQTEKYQWQFLYIGSEASTHSDAAAIGIRNSGFYQKTKAGVRGMSVDLSVSVSDYRTLRGKGDLKAKLKIDKRIKPVDPASSGSDETVH